MIRDGAELRNQRANKRNHFKPNTLYQLISVSGVVVHTILRKTAEKLLVVIGDMTHMLAQRSCKGVSHLRVGSVRNFQQERF